MGLTKNSRIWLIAVTGILAAAIVAAGLLPRSFMLTAFSDISQMLLLLSGAAAFVPLALRCYGRIRLFWFLTALSMTLWLAYQLFWTYYEIVLRRDVPDLCAWDVVLFLHMVPLMAALGLRPQCSRDEYSARVGRLDFALLLVWWFYLYVLIVMPWQYVVPDVAAYNRDLNNVYSAEKIALLVALLGSWAISKGEWRRIYAYLFGMSFCYSGASTLANWAIAKRTYYTGSFYDIPLLAAMASLTWIALSTRRENLDSDTSLGSSSYGLWFARFSMITVFSLPLFALWAMSAQHIPPRVRLFRVSLTFLAAFCMGVIILVRQRMLDRELVRLLEQSRDAFDNLKRLQAQILQSEKLASVGQLVGGAAHELNNPITAMLGYSDLLLNTRLSAEQHSLAVKIGQYVRRTKSLVASLISFARQAPAPKGSLDLNTLVRTAVKLTEPQWKTAQLRIDMVLDSSLPKVWGDSNQLLQVCVQFVNSCVHVFSEGAGSVLTLTTLHDHKRCLLQIATPPQPSETHGLECKAREDSLGLSACQGIIQEHRGRIVQERTQDCFILSIELPALDRLTDAGKESTVPVMWQSQPYA